MKRYIDKALKINLTNKKIDDSLKSLVLKYIKIIEIYMVIEEAKKQRI